MIRAVPKWVMQRYAKLWKKYNGKEMTYNDIQTILKGDGRNTISVFLNELRKAGWVEVKLSQKDGRMRVYKLRQPEKIMVKMEE